MLRRILTGSVFGKFFDSPSKRKVRVDNILVIDTMAPHSRQEYRDLIDKGLYPKRRFHPAERMTRMYNSPFDPEYRQW